MNFSVTRKQGIRSRAFRLRVAVDDIAYECFTPEGCLFHTGRPAVFQFCLAFGHWPGYSPVYTTMPSLSHVHFA